MSDQRAALGRRGEDLAVEFLLAAGFEILTRNFRLRGGELDIVARDGDTLVFVEVRTKSHQEFGHPLETVDARKQAQIVRMARCYLHRKAVSDRVPCRFDVIGILLGAQGEPAIQHIRNAFQARA